MKTSGILLLLSALLIGLKVVKPELTGILFFSDKGAPKNSIVKFWMNKFEYKNMPDTLTVNFKHLKLDGGETIELEILPEGPNQTACFVIPENQTYSVVKDTLIIHAQRSVRDASYIKIYKNIESIEVVGGTTLFINNVNQRHLNIHVKDKSKLKLIRMWISRNVILDDVPMLENFKVKATGESHVELSNLVTSTISADINNSMLKYWSSLEADTLQVNLSGKSNARSMNFPEENGVNTLIVSGNKTYFKPDLVGKGVKFVEE